MRVQEVLVALGSSGWHLAKRSSQALSSRSRGILGLTLSAFSATFLLFTVLSRSFTSNNACVSSYPSIPPMHMYLISR